MASTRAGNDAGMERELMREAAELYGLAADEFTAARNARAKELRGEQAELAAQVARLPKPTAAAAAVNRLARDEPSEVRALVQAGRALRSAQEAAVAGGSAGAVTDATREHRAALERVRREARRLGLSAAVLDRVTASLRAASIDPELQPLLERGLLAREEQAAGFGLDPAQVVAAAPRRGKPREGEAAARAQARERVQRAQERLAEARRAARAAERELARLEGELEAARAAAAAATADVDEAERALAEARGGAPPRGRGRRG